MSWANQKIQECLAVGESQEDAIERGVRETILECLDCCECEMRDDGTAQRCKARILALLEAPTATAPSSPAASDTSPATRRRT